jgi:hypothetical protein
LWRSKTLSSALWQMLVAVMRRNFPLESVRIRHLERVRLVVRDLVSVKEGEDEPPLSAATVRHWRGLPLVGIWRMIRRRPLTAFRRSVVACRRTALLAMKSPGNKARRTWKIECVPMLDRRLSRLILAGRLTSRLRPRESR